MRIGSQWPLASSRFAVAGRFLFALALAVPATANAGTTHFMGWYESRDAAKAAHDAYIPQVPSGNRATGIINAGHCGSPEYPIWSISINDIGSGGPDDDQWCWMVDRENSCSEYGGTDADGKCIEPPECEDGAPSVSGSVALNPAAESCVNGCVVTDAPGEVSITTPSDGKTWGNFVETGDVCTGGDGDVQPMPSDNCYTGGDGETICYPMSDNPQQCGSFNGHYVCLDNMAANTCEFGGDSAVCTGGEMPDLMGTETITDSMEVDIDSDGSGPEDPENVSQHTIGHNTSSGTTTGGGDDITTTPKDENPDGSPCDPATEDCGMTIDVGVSDAGRDGGEGIDTSEFDQAMGEANDAMQTTQDDGAWDTPSLSAPMQPSQSCSAFDLDTGQFGQTYSMDLCPFISLVQTALAWFFSLITAIAIFHEWRTA